MLRRWIFGCVGMVVAVAFLACSPENVLAWQNGRCNNGCYYLGGNGFRGHGLFLCGGSFGGGWEGGPNGGIVGLGYINTAYHGTVGDVRRSKSIPPAPVNAPAPSAYDGPDQTAVPIVPPPVPAK